MIISNSISGAIANRDQCPAIPYTPEEYAAEARRSVDEGASQIHIHARTPDGMPSYEIADFQAITEAIVAEVGPEVIINYSTGALGVSMEKRLEYLRALTPDVAALNMGSMNYAKYSRRRKDFVFKAVFENSFDTIIEFLTEFRDARDQARARVLRRRPRRQPRSDDRPRPGRGAASDLAGHGRDRRDPAEHAQHRLHGRPDPGRPRDAAATGR